MIFDRQVFLDDPAASQALANLDAGKWRKARDSAKDLCKQDKARYRPLLVAANAGLYEEMMARGMKAEAAQVFAYLRTIATPEEIAQLSKLAESAPNAAVSSQSRWTAAADLARILNEGKEPAPEAWRAADELVALGAPETFQPGSAEAGISLELEAIQTASAATAEGKWEAAQEALRGLPRKSPFQHWRMLLRGIRCLHSGEKTAATQCFAALPKGSAPSRAADPWRHVLGLPTERPASAAVCSALCAVGGAPRSWGAVIADANQRWNRDDRVGAYRALRSALGQHFPSEEPNLAGLLSRTILTTDEAPTERGLDELVSEIDAQVFGQRVPDVNHRRILRRFLIQAQAPALCPEDIEADWAELLRLEQKLSGPSPVRDALGWLEAGRVLRAPKPSMMGILDIFGGKRRREPRDARRSRTALERAVELDPSNEDAQLELLEFYREQGDTKALNKHVEAMTLRLPGNKHALLQAGALAVERKAFGKGLEFLRQARSLDPLDPEATRQILIGLVMQARDARKKSKTSALDTIWQEAEPLLTDDATLRTGEPDMMRLRWTFRMRQSVLENQEDRAVAFREEAWRMAPSKAACLILERVLATVYGISGRAAWPQDWSSTIRDARWTDILPVLRSTRFGLMIQGAERHRTTLTHDLAHHFTPFREALAKRKAEIDPDAVFALALSLDAWSRGPRCWADQSDVFTNWLMELLGDPHPKKKMDVRLQMASALCHLSVGSYIAVTPEALRSIAERAEAAGHRECAAVAREALNRLARRFVGYGDKDDEDDSESWDDDELDDLPPPPVPDFNWRKPAPKKEPPAKKAAAQKSAPQAASTDHQQFELPF